jgi:hypothetical protein
MLRRCGALIVGLSGAWVAAAGCAASGSNGEINGPMFEFDSGGDAGEELDAGQASDGASTQGSPDAGGKSDGSKGDASDANTAGQGDASDASSTGDTGATGADGGCVSTTLLLGGSSSSLFSATATGTGAFAASPISGSATTPPALVSFGGGFQALFTAAGDAGGGNAIYATSFGATGWSSPAPLGGSADAIGAPSIAVVGSTVQGAYLNASHLFFHATFSTSWDTGADPVRPDGGAQAFGPVAPAAVGTSTQFVIAYQGNNLLPYAQTWTSGAGWDDGVSLGSANLLASTGIAVASLQGGSADMIAVFVESGGSCTGASSCLYATTRDGSSHGWSSPALVNAAAYTPATPTLTSMTGGRALLAWKGGDNKGYGSVYTAGASPLWSTPAPLTSMTIAGAPSLAQGVCGDDAVAAFVSSGQVYTTHLAGGAWTTASAYAAASSESVVSIATSP